MAVDEPGTLAHIPNSQYDADSAPNQNVNCGPTTVTNSLKFHLRKDFAINATRRLATSSNGVGTTISQRKTMFDKRGVPADVHKLSYSAMKARLDGTRTFDIALLMSLIPITIRRRPFPGSHSVEALTAGVVSGVPGIYVNNPDFHADRDQKSRTFIPDRYLKPAFDALGGYAVIPRKARVMPTRYPYRRSMATTAIVNARSGPGTNFSRVRTLAKGYRFTSTYLETAGGWYDNRTRRDWVALVVGGKTVWVARKYTREV